MRCLAVKGNYFDKHPDYQALLINYFPNLKELDSWQITDASRTMAAGKELRRQLIPFMYAVD